MGSSNSMAGRRIRGRIVEYTEENTGYFHMSPRLYKAFDLNTRSIMYHETGTRRFLK